LICRYRITYLYGNLQPGITTLDENDEAAETGDIES